MRLWMDGQVREELERIEEPKLCVVFRVKAIGLIRDLAVGRALDPRQVDGRSHEV